MIKNKRNNGFWDNAGTLFEIVGYRIWRILRKGFTIWYA